MAPQPNIYKLIYASNTVPHGANVGKYVDGASY
jgi:hypothetical protein